jgi:hypothetical protein
MLTDTNAPSAADAPQISLVPPVDRVTVLESQIGDLQDQLATAKAQVIVLDRHKSELLERLKAHEGNAFSLVFANLESGSYATEAAKQIADLAELVRKRGEKGKLSLSITIKPFNDGALLFVPSPIKISEPPVDPQASIFFITGDGQLTRNQEKQGDLFHP